MDPDDGAVLTVDGLSKTFTLHLQGGAAIRAVAGVTFSVFPGECVVLSGPSGAGKSSILKMVGGSYRPSAGAIRVRHDGRMVDLARLSPRELATVRRASIGQVTQFLRVIPRVPAIEVVAEPLLAAGWTRAAARERAAGLLARLNVPERLFPLPPATFSGGEKQRVNIARGLARPVPLLLLDEPTAALDAPNRAAVAGLVREARTAGAAILAVFHDADVRDALADRVIDVSRSGGAAP